MNRGWTMRCPLMAHTGKTYWARKTHHLRSRYAARFGGHLVEHTRTEHWLKAAGKMMAKTAIVGNVQAVQPGHQMDPELTVMNG